MFGAAAKKAAAYAKLAELQTAYDALDKAHAEFMKETESLRNRAFLMDIRTEGRKNVFYFMRKGTIQMIETYSLIADDVAGWKKDLL